MSDTVEIVVFSEPLFGIAVNTEIKGLGKAFMRVMLDHLTKLDHGRIDPFQLQAWHDYEGMPVVMVPYGDELMIYVVEQAAESGEPTVKINVMFAGARTRGYHGMEGTWDGSDESLWRDIILTRCNLHFSN